MKVKVLTLSGIGNRTGFNLKTTRYLEYVK